MGRQLIMPTWVQKIFQQSIFVLPTLYAGYIFVTDFKLEYLGWLAVSMVMVAAVISAYYHRFVTHRSWNCPRWAEYVFIVLAGMFALTQVVSWVATHKKHHRYVDTDRDPHGPHKGLLCNLAVAYYDFNLAYAGRSVLEDKLYQFQIAYYHILIVFGIAVMTYFFSFDAWAIMVAYGYLGQVAVNYLGHKDLKAISRPGIAWLLAGEPYHDIHHARPKVAIFGKWDLGGLIVRLFDRNALSYKQVDFPQK